MVSARTPGTRAAAGRSVLATPAIPHVRQPSALKRRFARGFAGGIPARHVVLPLLDVVAAALAVYLAFALRFDDLTPVSRLAAFLPVVLLPLAVRPLVNRWFDLYSHSWRYVSVPELLRLLIATAAGSAIMVAAFIACALVAHPLVDGFPRSFWLLEGGLSLALMGFLRLAPRIVADASAAQSPCNWQSRTIMYGAGDAGAMMARGAARQPSAGVLPSLFSMTIPRSGDGPTRASRCEVVSASFQPLVPGAQRRQGARPYGRRDPIPTGPRPDFPAGPATKGGLI